jgi:hypothetical protein
MFGANKVGVFCCLGWRRAPWQVQTGWQCRKGSRHSGLENRRLVWLLQGAILNEGEQAPESLDVRERAAGYTPDGQSGESLKLSRGENQEIAS